jgi:hypothetical protein
MDLKLQILTEIYQYQFVFKDADPDEKNSLDLKLLFKMEIKQI